MFKPLMRHPVFAPDTGAGTPDASSAPNEPTPAPASSAAPADGGTPNVTPNAQPSSPPAENVPPKDAQDASSTPPASDQDQDPTPTEGYKIPDAYKDKPWASKIKSEEDLWKALDGAQGLIGKKTIIPDLEKATEAEREEYFKQTRPTSIDAYEFGDAIDPTLKTGIAESLMKNGISAVQANAIIKDYQAGESALLAAQYDPDAMAQTMEQSFGKDWQTTMGNTKNALTNVMSPEDNALIDNLPNTYISLIYRTFGNVINAVEKVRSEYGIKESTAHILAGSGTTAPPNIDSERAAIRGQIAQLNQKPHTAADKQALIDKLNKTYESDPRIARKA